MYLFIVGCAGCSLFGLFSSCSEQGLLSGRGAWASHCGGFSVGEYGLLVSRASVIVGRGLSCSAQCGFRLDKGWNPKLLH